MKVLLLFVVLVTAAAAVPQRPPGRMLFDPRFGRRPRGPGGPGFGPMRHFRPNFGLHGKPWHRGYRPRPTFSEKRNAGPGPHHGPKMAVHSKPAPKKHAPGPVQEPQKHDAIPVQHKGPKIIVHEPIPHGKVPRKPLLHKPRPAGPILRKMEKVQKAPLLVHKKPATHRPMAVSKKSVLQRNSGPIRPGIPPYGGAKVVYVYIPYCPKRPLYGPPQMFPPIMPEFEPSPSYEPALDYGFDAFPQDFYQPDYREIDLEEPSYGLQSKPRYGAPAFSPSIEYSPSGYGFSSEKKAPTQTNHAAHYVQDLKYKAPYKRHNYKPSEHKSQPNSKSQPSTLKQDVNFVEPVGFSKTEKHYATKPVNYTPEKKYVPPENNPRPFGYLPTFENFNPGAKFPSKFEDIK